MNNPLIFDIAMGRAKPENIRNQEAPCPFCAVDKLTNILAREGNIIWLMNKYPVLKGTWPTVIVESNDCHGEFSRFAPEEAARVLDFSLRKWQETIHRKEFKSVLYLKNYGPMSGGSLRHPHSQIIGLRDYDYREDIHPYHFEGWTISESSDILTTLSTHPIIGFFEFNFRFTPEVSVQHLAGQLQGILRYLIKDFSRYSTSYNIFLYDLGAPYYYAKIVPRYLTSPLFVGFGISQVCNEERAAQVIRDLQPYLPDSSDRSVRR